MSDTIIKNISSIFFILGFLGICLGPFISICMKNKYDVFEYSKIFWPVTIGFLLYMLSYRLYSVPNDSLFEKILIVFIAGSIIFSLSAISLISLRMRFAAT